MIHSPRDVPQALRPQVFARVEITVIIPSMTQPQTVPAELDTITGAIVDAALQIHRALGPGLLESVYEAVLTKALQKRGMRVERQKAIRFEYDDMNFEEGFRADLVVEECVIVELKSVEVIGPVHGKQVLTYLRLARLPVGLLINFGAPTLKEGLHRIVNQLPPTSSPFLRINHAPLGTHASEDHAECKGEASNQPHKKPRCWPKP